MRSILFLSFVVALVAFTGCKQKQGTQPGEPKQVTAQPGKAGTPGGAKSEGGHDYTFLTYKMLQYRAALVPGKDPKEQPYAGQWMKLNSDGTFKSGKYSEQTHTGKWTYNGEAKVLFLNPDGQEYKPSEWNVIFNDDMIVFIGTPTYGNSGTQIQLIRIDKFPEKQ
ncbi:MAG: hypothetical protein ABIQ02_09160 [Saprospiraceae bacterium]